MKVSLYATLGFLAHLARDLAGTLRDRWRRFQRRVVLGEECATIAMDIFPFLEPMTGVGVYEWNLVSALARRDDGLSFNLYAHTFLAPGEAPLQVIPKGPHMRLRRHELPIGFLLPMQGTISFLRGVVEPLLRVLDHNDVLFAPNFFAPSTQLPYGRTTVATVHDVAFATMPETVAPETLAHLRSNLGDTLYRSERVIAVSEATAEDLVEQIGVNRRRVHVVHEGLDPAFAQTDEAQLSPPPEGTPDRYLLFVSTLEPRKNVIGVLKAFRLLLEWGYGGDLVLVGRWGWRTDALRAELKAFPSPERIHHLDRVPREQLPALYRGADALLFPSLLEGFGLPLLEAMASGTPVVTSGRSSMPEVAGPAAVYIDPERPHGIASAVGALLEDPQHSQRLGELGRKRAAAFSWERAAETTAEILRQAAGLPPRGPDEYRV